MMNCGKAGGDNTGSAGLWKEEKWRVSREWGDDGGRVDYNEEDMKRERYGP